MPNFADPVYLIVRFGPDVVFIHNLFQLERNTVEYSEYFPWRIMWLEIRNWPRESNWTISRTRLLFAQENLPWLAQNVMIYFQDSLPPGSKPVSWFTRSSTMKIWSHRSAEYYTEKYLILRCYHKWSYEAHHPMVDPRSTITQTDIFGMYLLCMYNFSISRKVGLCASESPWFISLFPRESSIKITTLGVHSRKDV